MSEKPKVAFYWCASCGGCEESIVDLAEDLLEVVGAIEIVLWPVAMDFKKHDIEEMPDSSILAALVNGSIRTSEQEEMARLLRRKSKILVAYGSCAQLGGIPSLANQFDKEHILEYVYQKSPSVVNESKVLPQRETQDKGFSATLPRFHTHVRSLDQIVEVDYFLPGCPPTPKLIKQALTILLSGKLPPKGTVLAPDVALCEECARKSSKPTDLQFSRFVRPHEIMIDPDKCLLAQGILCMGPATRGGCEALCVQGNMPCTGCFGPTSRVRDQGAKMLSSLASSVEAKEEREIEEILAGIPDPVGSFYRYGMSKSLLRGKLF